MTWLKANQLALVALAGVLLTFFYPIWGKGKLPIPADALVGLYHPFRDFYAGEYPNGIPFKNFLITDPVRQQFLWKQFAIDQLKQGKIPWWNPYTHSGTPFLANVQAGVFYPLNLVFFLFNFINSWSIYILLQPFLAGAFLYAYLSHKQLKTSACLLGSLAFIFGGFFLVWLEWGNIGHTLLWLPLLLLSIDKIITQESQLWPAIFILSLVSQFFAGHLQISFYTSLTAVGYTSYKLSSLSRKKRLKYTKLFSFYFLVFIIATAIQWLPTLQFIKLSARSIDQTQVLTRPDWFLPWQHLAQFIAPDFFGNPATLNYWGVWNYAEFVGYIGIIPLSFALYSLVKFKKDARFFAAVTLTSLIFALPTPIAKLPFMLNLPLISQAQPSRLLSLITFSLAILSAHGFNTFIKELNLNPSDHSQLPKTFLGVLLALGFLWLATLKLVPSQSISVARRNLILPTIVLITSIAVLRLAGLAVKCLKPKKAKLFLLLTPYSLLLISLADVYRFAVKFTPFSSRNYLFPQTRVINYLQANSGNFRIMSLDRRILPPNTAMAYKLHTIEGYDPLYLKSYAQLITQLETGKHQTNPIAFNRIIKPQNINSELINLLSVKYLLSLTEIDRDNLQLVFQEGQTKVYQNTSVLPRARLLSGEGRVAIIHSLPNSVLIKVDAKTDSVLELADMMYPGWFAKVDGVITKISSSPHNFRQISVSQGEHLVEFFFAPLVSNYTNL